MGKSFKEDDIRPDRLKQDQAAVIASDIKLLLDSEGEFVDIPCPACQSGRKQLLFVKNRLHYQECRGCQTVYVSPRPTPEALERFYRQSENYAYWSEHIFPATEASRRERIFRPRVDRILEICRRLGGRQETLLEVGAGFGTFCEEMRGRNAFKRIIGVEPTPKLAAVCRSRGIEVLESPIEDVELTEGDLDLVVSFEVIEHLFAPREFVRSCARFLRRDGLLVLSCPNVKGFEMTVLGERSNSFDHEHLNYFHPSSLSSLLSQEGLETLEVATPGELDAELVRKKLLEAPLGNASDAFLQQVLGEQWEALGQPFQDFLKQAKLSSHMWIVARKY